MAKREVVITGIGAASGFGPSAGALWEGLESGRSALSRPTRIDLSGFPARLGAEIPEFSAKDFVPKSYRKAVKVMARDTEIAVACAKDACASAAFLTRGDEGATPTYPGERVACNIGAGLIAAETGELTVALATSVDATNPALAHRGGFDYRRWGTIHDGRTAGGGMDNLQPLWMLKYLPNMLACHVTIIHGCEGPSNTITCKEASGLLSIGESARVIERGSADAALAGSAESLLNLMSVMRYTISGRLGDVAVDADARRAVRPYSGESTAVAGEGGGILVLEEAGAARARGAKPLATVAGFGAAIGGYDGVLAKDGVNDGLVLAIRAALRDAGTTPADIDAVVPQATGSPLVDAPEAAALREVFGDRLATLELVTVTPAIGDTGAGTGGLLAAVAAMIVREQRLPARLGADVPGLCCGPRASVAKRVKNVLAVSSAMGGQNAALVLRAP
ncbi:MAG TPA: beta-ketoacyl synthase N-terminal-like domain-containing protein [Phycisphaerales bacterium]|nr:beta-ketoacyl synthase N-terminal-like domain-containing protein [Phycisphaerales bacterium]